MQLLSTKPIIAMLWMSAAFVMGIAGNLGQSMAAIAVSVVLGYPGLHASPQVIAGVVYPRAMQQFLERIEQPHHYRAWRRLEAENGGAGKRGWLEAWTEVTPSGAFRYEVVAEGGSDYIRTRVLRAVLEGEKDMMARGVSSGSAIASANYTFESAGVDGSGLVKMLLVPRRRDGMLLTGAMFLDQTEGDLVRVEGRLAKNPSFWVKKVDIVRDYRRIAGVLLPVGLQSTAQVRFVGSSTLRMTYDYTAINGRPVERHSRGCYPPRTRQFSHNGTTGSDSQLWVTLRELGVHPSQRTVAMR